MNEVKSAGNPVEITDHKYPPETAGRVMITNIPLVSPDDTISKIEEMLLKKVKEFETINYIYVAYKNGKLAGVISIKDILRQPKTKKVSEIMIKNLITAHPYTDQEKVAYLAIKNNIKAIPIIDKDGIFLGIVPFDTILNITYQEAAEDVFRAAGFHNPQGFAKYDNVLTMPIWQSIKHRLPWLLLGLLGGILAAKIVGAFENTLEKNLILAAFIPLIVYMADAVGTQMEAFIIRDFAVSPQLKFSKYFFKQLYVILLIAAITSTVLFLATYLIYGGVIISTILAIGLLAAIISSLLTGLVVPYLFNKLKQDPANASGPVATIIQDLLSVLVYFFIASLLL